MLGPTEYPPKPSSRLQIVKLEPYAGEATIVVLTRDDFPEIKIARGTHGPREEFIIEVVRRVCGRQPDGRPHEWEILRP